MPDLRRMMLTAWVWLTAGMTLLAATPQWQCRCADLGRAPACCCEPQAPPVTATVRSCCHAQPARQTSSHRLPTAAPTNVCLRALTAPASQTVERPQRLDVVQPVQGLPGELPTRPRHSDGPHGSACGFRHALAPPFDRVLIFEHFLL